MKDNTQNTTLYRVTFTEQSSGRKNTIDVYALDPEAAKKKAKEELFDGIFYISVKSKLNVTVKPIKTDW